MSRSERDDSRSKSRKIQDAARKLERAVEELASAATDEVSGRAARLLDEAAARVRGQSGGGGGGKREAASDAVRREHRSRQIHRSDYEDLSRRSREPYLDRENRKIVGVCGGIARYLGIEAWMARCAALTGLLFVPSIVFPAYWIAFFVMGRSPTDRESTRKARVRVGGYPAREHAEKRRSRAKGRRRAARRGRRTYDQKRDHRSPAPEFGARFSPRRSLRAAQADFAEVELRLRRMEAFVTSDRYVLERGFAEIDANAAAESPSQTIRNPPGSDKEQ